MLKKIMNFHQKFQNNYGFDYPNVGSMCLDSFPSAHRPIHQLLDFRQVLPVQEELLKEG